MIILACYFLLYKTSNKGEFAAIIKENVGRPIAFVLFVLYGFYFAFLTFLGLRDIAEVITIFMIHDFPVYVAGIAILAVVIYGLYHGIGLLPARQAFFRAFGHIRLFSCYFDFKAVAFRYFPDCGKRPYTFHQADATIRVRGAVWKTIRSLIICQFVLEKKNFTVTAITRFFIRALLLLISVYNIIIWGRRR